MALYLEMARLLVHGPDHRPEKNQPVLPVDYHLHYPSVVPFHPRHHVFRGLLTEVSPFFCYKIGCEFNSVH